MEEIKLPLANTPSSELLAPDEPAECDTTPTRMPTAEQDACDSIDQIESTMPHGLAHGLDTINDRDMMYDTTNRNNIPESSNRKGSNDSTKITETCQFAREADQPEAAVE